MAVKGGGGVLILPQLSAELWPAAYYGLDGIPSEYKESSKRFLSYFNR